MTLPSLTEKADLLREGHDSIIIFVAEEFLLIAPPNKEKRPTIENQESSVVRDFSKSLCL